jgi:HEAT repeat protein
VQTVRITITTKGKYTALEANAIEPLVNLVDDENSEVRANALKVCLYELYSDEGIRQMTTSMVSNN